MTPALLMWLDAVTIDERPLVGGKAATLGTLLKAGCPVPDGFCITTKAYHDFVNALDQPRLSTTQDASKDERIEAITAAPFPRDLRTQVLAAYHHLRRRHGGDMRVAVRSSASVEDLPDASFAGQYISVLDITNEASLLEAIKQCWLSAFSPQVQAYRKQRALDDARLQMAVIVQVMVSADFAGVLFTADPVTGDTTHLVVEMTPGLGDKVAAGKTMPFRLTLDRQAGTAAHSSPLAPGWRTANHGQIDWKPLVKLALRAEALFQSPQDIEWVYGDHRFSILQSRPITVPLRPTCRQIWTRANVGEIFPGVVSSLTWSIFEPVLHMAGSYRARSPLTLHHKWSHPCGAWPDSPRLFDGRVYMELASVYAGFGSLPGVSPHILQRMLGFEFHLCRPDELPEKHPRWHVMDPYRALRFWLEMAGITDTLAKKAEGWLREERANDFVSTGASRETQAELALCRIDRLLPRTAKILGLHLQCTAMAFSALGLLDRLARKYAAPKEVEAFESGLVADFQGMSTVQQVIAIWDLAQAARQVPLVERTLFEESNGHALEVWRNTPGALDFLMLWDSFIDRFGDRGVDEFELSAARWDQDPSLVLQAMREALDQQSPDPRERLERVQEVGQQQVQRMLECIKAKGSAWEVWFFRRLVVSYQRNTLLRENLKHSLVSKFNALRKAFIALGELLEQAGVISSCDGIFFLRYEEILEVIENPTQLSFNPNALIAQRKKDHTQWTSSAVSDVWVSMDGEESPMELPSWDNPDTLQGIGCSAGQVAGTARVLTSIREGVSLSPGQILVVPSIDPGWTPLFLTAGGLVTEIGGVLSHGATVAREYGLPAVVSVPDATKKIRDGQQIMIDGFTGLVHLNDGAK